MQTLSTAGSLPGEALGPGVPGGAAKLSEIAKVGEKYCRNLAGKCWRNWRFVCLYDFLFFFWRSWAYGDRPLSLKVVSEKADKSYIWMVSAFLNGISGWIQPWNQPPWSVIECRE